MSYEVLMDFMMLWNLIEEVELQPEVPDIHIWRLSASGQYTATSAYNALFEGATRFEPYERIWKSWAPSKMSIFYVAGGP